MERPAGGSGPASSGTPADGELQGVRPPASVLCTLLEHLADQPKHPNLGLPVLELVPFMDWSHVHDIPTSAMVARKVRPHDTMATLPSLLAGDVAAIDGPLEGGMWFMMSNGHCKAFEVPEKIPPSLRGVLLKTTAVVQNFSGILKSWSSGDLRPVLLRNVLYHASSPTAFLISYHFLVIVHATADQDARLAELERIPGENHILSDGHHRLCMMILLEPDLDITDERIWAGAMRDHMALKYVPAMVITCTEQGHVLSQNAVSLATLGVLGSDQLLTDLPEDCQIPAYQGYQPLNYLQELFGSQMSTVLSQVTVQGTFRKRVRLKSSTLLQLMELPMNSQVYHDVSISRLRDGVTGETVFIVAQVDVTGVVQAERQVQKLQKQQRALLQKILPQQVIDVLLEENKAPESLGPYAPDTPSHHAGAHHQYSDGDVASSLGRDNSLEHMMQYAAPDLADESVGLEGFSGPRTASNRWNDGTPRSDVSFTSDFRPAAETLLAVSQGREEPPGPVEVGSTGDVQPGASNPASHTTHQLLGGRAVGSAVGGTSLNQASAFATVTNLIPDAAETEHDKIALPSIPFLRSASYGSFKQLQLSSADVQRLSTYHECVSVLFTDIQGFTAMSQQLHPSQVMLFLNNLYSVFDSLLEEFDVYKVETIGDCYMVCSGLFDRSSPEHQPDLAAELELREEEVAASDASSDAELELLQPHANAPNDKNESWHQKGRKDVLGGYDPQHASKMIRFAKALLCAANAVLTPLGEPVRMRVGIHSGPIMTGVVGRKMPRFCCFGDTVNTGSLLESTGSVNSIHASAAFKELTPDEAWVPTEGVEVKGKGMVESFTLEFLPEWDTLAYDL